jgi:hypothetical protein
MLVASFPSDFHYFTEKSMSQRSPFETVSNIQTQLFSYLLVQTVLLGFLKPVSRSFPIALERLQHSVLIFAKSCFSAAVSHFAANPTTWGSSAEFEF